MSPVVVNPPYAPLYGYANPIAHPIQFYPNGYPTLDGGRENDEQGEYLRAKSQVPVVSSLVSQTLRNCPLIYGF